MGRKVVPVRRVTCLPELPLDESIFHTFPYKTRRTAYGKQKVGPARRVTRLPGSPFCQLLPCKHFSSPSQVNSVKARQSEHDRASLARAKGLTFFLIINARRSWLG